MIIPDSVLRQNEKPINNNQPPKYKVFWKAWVAILCKLVSFWALTLEMASGVAQPKIRWPQLNSSPAMTNSTRHIRTDKIPPSQLRCLKYLRAVIAKKTKPIICSVILINMALRKKGQSSLRTRIVANSGTTSCSKVNIIARTGRVMPMRDKYFVALPETCSVSVFFSQDAFVASSRKTMAPAITSIR